MKIRPALKKAYLFHELEGMKSWYCKNNYKSLGDFTLGGVSALS